MKLQYRGLACIVVAVVGRISAQLTPAATTRRLGAGARTTAIGDIDGDGRLDIATSDGLNATVLYGRCIP